MRRCIEFLGITGRRSLPASDHAEGDTIRAFIYDIDRHISAEVTIAMNFGLPAFARPLCSLKQISVMKLLLKTGRLLAARRNGLIFLARLNITVVPT
jgi:hypothetical protein